MSDPKANERLYAEVRRLYGVLRRIQHEAQCTRPSVSPGAQLEYVGSVAGEALQRPIRCDCAVRDPRECSCPKEAHR